MIKVSVLYPKSADVKFDISYYCKSHIPLVKTRFGGLCKSTEVEEGLSGATPGSEPPFFAVGHFYFESVGDFQAAFQPHAAEILGDIQNYTDVQPIIQISEVRL